VVQRPVPVCCRAQPVSGGRVRDGRAAGGGVVQSAVPQLRRAAGGAPAPGRA